MNLDQTRFEKFWENPEWYRIEYIKNLTPKDLSYGLQRGLAFHILCDMDFRNASLPAIEAKFKEDRVTDPKAIDNAYLLKSVYDRDRTPYEIVATEREFLVPIGDGHNLAGRLDQILDTGIGLINGELKTGYEKTRKNWEEKRWKTKRQADTLLIGSRFLGFDVAYVLPIYAIESVPPQLWELDPVYRTEHELEQTKLAFAETCTMIESLRAKYGDDSPWPHLRGSWPCDKDGACPFEMICGRDSSTWDANDLKDYAERREHLAILR